MADTPFHQALRQIGFTIDDPARWPVPEVLIRFGDAPGDDLLCTTLLRELRKRGQKSIWMMTTHPELFAGNPDVDVIAPLYAPLATLIRNFGLRYVEPWYAPRNWLTDRDEIPTMHILAKMCQIAGLQGEITPRPYIHLTPAEKAYGQFSPKQIAIHSTGLGGLMPIRNKEWLPERFQEIVDALKNEYTFVQLGKAGDPLLSNTIDLRGKTTLRQTAAVLGNSLAFVGLVGFLMHLARAMEIRSVIIYGGRELPWQSGYKCNENLSNQVPCSPCWLCNKCDFERKCILEIKSDAAIDALRRLLARKDETIEDESLIIPT